MVTVECIYIYIYIIFLFYVRFCGTCADHTELLHRWQCGLLPPSPCHQYLAFLPVLSLPNLPTPTLSLPYSPHPNRPQCVIFPSLYPWVLIVQLPLTSENMWCLVFCSCVRLLRMMVSSFIHVLAKDINSSFSWLHSIPWCISATFSLSSLSLWGFGLVPSLCHCK